MTASKAITEFAPAKLNLCLHVTGQRADGYHLLESIVCFASVGDRVTVEPADDLSLTITGPMADGLSADDDNLVLRAARALSPDRGARITLEKHLPVASGIGGGSADAAATLRALSQLWNLPLPDADTVLSLGADVPVCLASQTARMRGIGEQIDDLGPAPMLDMLLVNPRVAVPTGTIFGGLARKENPPLADDMPDPFDTTQWVTWLAAQRNDLEAPAIAAQPVIDDVLNALRAQGGCQLARMSGSGATCFAIFSDDTARDAAEKAMQRTHPDWWITASDEWAG